MCFLIELEKTKIMEDTGITPKQLTCWFSNNRKRYWKPKMEEMGRYVVEQIISLVYQVARVHSRFLLDQYSLLTKYIQ